MQTGPTYRVVVFSSLAPYAVMRLVSRVHEEAPGAQVCGVLYERRVRGKPLRRRLVEFLRNLRDPAFVAYAAARAWRAFLSPFARLGDAALRFLHASGAKAPPPASFGLEDLSAFCAKRDCSLFVTADLHAPESLEYVRALRADLGLVYGTRILKPALFEVPREGSINVHQRKVPDYRGGGPIGLWELLDGQTEIGVTVHRVAERVDEGAVVRATAVAVEPYDTLRSLALKADVVGVDLLARAVADFARGAAEERPQQGPGRTFRNPQPQQLRRYEKQLAARRPRFRPRPGRSAWKLLARTLLLAPYVCVRNWVRRARGSFPVLVLYHHVITDRPYCNGIPTELFLRHVEYLQRYYRVVDFPQALEMLKAGRVDEPTVVLTFDDGYGDNYLSLRAVMQATGVPVTLFVCPEHIEEQREFEHDVRWGLPGFRPLTWDEVRGLDRERAQIGSHTRSHFDCGSTDAALLERQIVGSKADLEERLGHEVSLFSFPWGQPPNMSPRATELARQTYPCVCSAFGGENHAGAGERPWHVRRCPHPDTLWELELTLQSALELKPVPELGGRLGDVPAPLAVAPSAS